MPIFAAKVINGHFSCGDVMLRTKYRLFKPTALVSLNFKSDKIKYNVEDIVKVTQLPTVDKKSLKSAVTGAVIAGAAGAVIGSLRNKTYLQFGFEFKDGKKATIIGAEKDKNFQTVVKDLKSRNLIEVKLDY